MITNEPQYNTMKNNSPQKCAHQFYHKQCNYIALTQHWVNVHKIYRGVGQTRQGRSENVHYCYKAQVIVNNIEIIIQKYQVLLVLNNPSLI